MRKITLCLLLLLGIILSGTAFSAERLRVVTTTEDLASLARAVGGERVEVKAVARGYQDPHFVEPKPSYLMLLRRADLLVAVGLELEVAWLPALVKQCRNPKLLTPQGYFDASGGCEILERSTGPVSRAEGDTHPLGNPHYWLDPANGAVIARRLAQKFSALAPGHSSYFEARRDDFLKRLEEAVERWGERAAKFRGTKVITYHRSWSNFAKRFGLDVVDYVEPKPGVPPSSAHTFALIKKIKVEKIPLILIEPYFDLKLPNRVAEQSGARVLVLYPSVGGAEDIDDYVVLFEHDLTLIARALAKTQ
jgi:zinc/manganese transport system substrate-binding protein